MLGIGKARGENFLFVIGHLLFKADHRTRSMGGRGRKPHGQGRRIANVLVNMPRLPMTNDE